MNKHIQQALKHLENANTAGYFQEMNKVEMPRDLKSIYAEYKSKFMQGLKTFDFNQQLDVFAGEVGKELDHEPFVGTRETVDSLRNLANQGSIQELLDILDGLFEKKPHYSYAQIKQNLQFALGNQGIPPNQMQGLLVFLGSSEVKTRLNS
jgi:hypothetical protein